MVRKRWLPVGASQIAPLTVVMIIAFDIPIAAMLATSFSPDMTLTHYRSLIETPIYLRVLGNTFWIAGLTTAACALLGYPLAYWMRTLSPRGRVVSVAMVVIPFWVSVLVRTYAWIVVLGNGGMVNRSLMGLGITGSPISFLYNEFGVVIGMTNVLLPFLVLPLFAAMLRVDERLLQAARSLGAADRDVFRRVFFPLTIPALGAGALLVFISSAGFFITPAILGGGRVPMIASMLDLLINQMPRWELAAAISSVLLAASLASYALYHRTAARSLA